MSERAEGGDSDERHSHERHEPFAWHEPTNRDEHDNTQPHAGNRTVNHGPDKKVPEGPEPGAEGLERRPGGRGDGPEGGGSGSGGADLGGFGDDELALRRMLHSAVDDIEPRTGTLDRLRRAVPARRARKRQAAVGMAATALFIGTAIPALVHVSHSGGTDPDTAMAGQSSQAQGGTGQSQDKGGDTGAEKGTGSTSVRPGKHPGKPGGKGRPGGGSTGSTGGANPSSTLSAGGVPRCTPAQLGSATGTAVAPDSAGVVYGTFRVVNVSTGACTVAGAGTVTPTAVGAADKTRISAARHTAGDAATGLPDPTQEVTGLVLQPGSAYEEKFAFVPSATCPAAGGGSATGGSATGGASPDPTPSATGGSADSAGSGGTTTQLMSEDGTAQGSVQVTHTAQGGSPAASATVPGQCAGTVYYTGVLAGS
ncbi:hypothetical protein AV521_35625 [Streptomyces sp. IMTB 2501]|uniref:hypothetical protein n=1 Tax=Streptomyces sp. IMTB 2501 TaxID=1776340 RepID=UPI00096C4E68|nr:hypothetical protein [Streptomyces sp. IMTB 2501]OLZ64394.1 hypothetical protein AV521_35625 [Streptomyces sp. IMTB 2501]